jgi:hypothetical protein
MTTNIKFFRQCHCKYSKTRLHRNVFRDFADEMCEQTEETTLPHCIASLYALRAKPEALYAEGA